MDMGNSVIGFVGRGTARVMAIRVECDPSTTLLRPVTPEYQAAAKKLYDQSFDSAIGMLKQAPMPAPAVKAKKVAEPEVSRKETRHKPCIIKVGGHSAQSSRLFHGSRKSAAVKYGSWYNRSDWHHDNCWKTHRDTQYR